jgi:2-methylcitrate dehydratase PrpD
MASAASAAAVLASQQPSALLSSYTHVGFDLDHTLARYRLDAFSPFLFGLLRDFLVARRGYPAQTFARLAFREAYTHKALIFDAKLGNCIKLGADKSVLAASHGTTRLPGDKPKDAETETEAEPQGEIAAPPRMLSAADIKAAYPTPLLDFDGSRHPRWHALYTFFEMPGAPLLQAMVEATDRGLLSPEALVGRSLPDHPYGHIFPAISAAYEYHLSSPHRGDYFPAFRANPARFLHTRFEVAQWLRRLRGGEDEAAESAAPKEKKPKTFVFLCTNSKMDYTELLCTFSFGPDWRNLFDLIIVDAKKPFWFAGEGQRPGSVTAPVTPMMQTTTAAATGTPAAAAASSAAPLASTTTATASGAVVVAGAPPNHVVRPFYFVDPATLFADVARGPATLADLAVPHAVFVHGNAPVLHTLFRSQMQLHHGGETEPRVIYFGDHLHTDCMATRQFTSWASGAVVEEIEPWHAHAHAHAHGHQTDHGEHHTHATSAEAAACKHHTFHKLDSLLLSSSSSSGSSTRALAHVQAQVAETPAFGSFFHHVSPPPECTDDGICAAAAASAPEGPGGVEWTYWHRVLSSHCDVVVGCLTDCIVTSTSSLPAVTSSSAVSAKSAAPAAASTSDAASSAAASSAAPPRGIGPRLHSSCIQPPTIVRFQPPPYGASFGREDTPARVQAIAFLTAQQQQHMQQQPQQQASNSPSAELPPPPVATLQYSVHRLPLSLKAEMRAIFPELSTWGSDDDASVAASATSSPSSSAATTTAATTKAKSLTASQFAQLPLLSLATFQPCAFPLLSYEPAVEREKNRLLECFDSWTRIIANHLRSRGHWADLVDPCTGYPTLGPHGSGVYSEVDAAAVLLAYRMEQVGNCSVVVHPTWGLSSYPASMLTTAPIEALKEAIEDAQKQLAVKEKQEESTAAASAAAMSSASASSSASSPPTGAVAAAPSDSSSSLTGLQRLARFALSLRFEDLPSAVVEQAVRVLADSLACALAAAAGQAELRTLSSRIGSASLPPEGSRYLWGSSSDGSVPLRAAPAQAALVNSSSIRCLDANDLFYGLAPGQNPMSFGHHSDALGGVMALMDPARNNGQQLLLATVIAYEVQASLSTCLDWLDCGLHSLSQVCVAVPAAAAAFPQHYGNNAAAPAAAAAATTTTDSQQSPAEKTLTNAMALGLSTGLCMNAWLKTKQKTHKPAAATAAATSAPASVAGGDEGVPSVKFVSVGLAASRGVESVQLATAAGVGANADALETLVRSFAGPERAQQLDSAARQGSVATLPSFERLASVPMPASHFSMHRQLVKRFAAQFNLQAPILCALALHEQGARVDNVARITFHGHAFSAAGVQGGRAAFAPRAQGDADHSTPFVLYAALRDGCFTPERAYANEGWLAAEVHQWLQGRVELVVDPALEQLRADKGVLSCRIEARLVDGRVLRVEQSGTPGHPDMPLSDAQLRAKWHELLDAHYGELMADVLWRACQALKHDDGDDGGKGRGAISRLEQLLCSQLKSSSE